MTCFCKSWQKSHCHLKQIIMELLLGSQKYCKKFWSQFMRAEKNVTALSAKKIMLCVTITNIV